MPAGGCSRRRVTDGGWLVDVHHPDSIAALQGPPDDDIARFLANQRIPSGNPPRDGGAQLSIDRRQ